MSLNLRFDVSAKDSNLINLLFNNIKYRLKRLYILERKCNSSKKRWRIPKKKNAIFTLNMIVHHKLSIIRDGFPFNKLDSYGSTCDDMLLSFNYTRQMCRPFLHSHFSFLFSLKSHLIFIYLSMMVL